MANQPSSSSAPLQGVLLPCHGRLNLGVGRRDLRLKGIIPGWSGESWVDTGLILVHTGLILVNSEWWMIMEFILENIGWSWYMNDFKIWPFYAMGYSSYTRSFESFSDSWSVNLIVWNGTLIWLKLDALCTAVPIFWRIYHLLRRWLLTHMANPLNVVVL